MHLLRIAQKASIALLVATIAVTISGCRDSGPGSTGAKWQQKENWRQIKPGMTIEQVREILGEPTKTQGDAAFVNWQYGPGKEGGRVVFAGGMVRDWTSPK